MKRQQTLVTIACLLITGCSVNPAVKPDPEFVSIRPIVSVPPPSDNGGIYQTGFGISLFSDVSAKRVGDVITVVLDENTNASKQSSTTTSKESSANTTIPTLLGRVLPIPGGGALAGAESGSDFKGQGDSSQSNRLTGRITVTVSEVLPNDYLVVQGEKRLTLNQGSEHIKFSGIIRPADIKADNTVSSVNVANAQIIYGSSGVLADANTQGWMSRFFNSPWWPF